MKTKLFFLILLSGFCFNGITAQEKSQKITIRGTVLNAEKEPIVSAIVMIDGKKTKTITDSKGDYKIRVVPTASKIGIFTFGYGIQEENINARSLINFKFENQPSWILHGSGGGISVLSSRKNSSGEEPVNVGYAHLKKKDVTTDIDFIDGTDKKYASYNSVIEMILRGVSGVRRQGNGIVLQNSANLFGAVSPLIIVDGMTGWSLNDIQPAEVKSISVLKGTAAAIYGSRGYGGVIIIETKTYDEY